MKKLLFTFLVIFLTSCASHDKQNKHHRTKITVEALQKDVVYTHKQLVKMHPDLYWYTSKEALDKKFDSLAQSITEPLTPNEFYHKISPIVSSVRQGHMSMNMFQLTSPDSLKKKYKGSTHPLSLFEYEYLDDRLFIERNRSKKDSILQKGTEILSINGIKPIDLFKKYRPTFTSDGFNETAIPYFFARKVNSYYVNELGFVDSVTIKASCADSVFYHTIKRTFKKSKRLLKEVEDSLQKNKIVDSDSLRKLSKKEQQIKRSAIKEQRKKQSFQKKWFGYDEKNKTYAKEVLFPVATDSTTAILKIRNFSEGKIKVYDTIFSVLHANNVEDLIIDLRGNPGGRLNEIHRLSRYLNDSTFIFTQPATITNRATYFNLLKEKSIPAQVFASPFIGIYSLVRGVSAKRNEDGLLQVPLKSSKSINPKPLNYTNNIYVLTDGMTFSAAAIISSHLKGRNRAVFVGEETGGTFNGTVAGIMPVLKLPHSKLKLRVGLMTIKPTQQTKEEGYGVKPDIYIKPTIDDFLNERDPALEYVLKEIAKKR